jgi:uncharacterized protein (TIGR00255 family)
MTGYGRCDGLVAGKAHSFEVRCVNHRFRDVRLSLPRQWLELEVEVERRIRDRFGRGRIECNIRATGSSSELGAVVLDEERARQVLQAYQRLAEVLELDETPSLSLVARAEGVIGTQPENTAIDRVRGDLRRLLDAALDAADSMRATEGEQLGQVIGAHLAALDALLEQIQILIPQEQETLQARTRERIQAMAESAEVPMDRMTQELALLAEKADVTEELSRLHSHRLQFADMLGRDGPVGRELDFLLQEMNREINTLCSKFHSAPVIQLAVAARAELEKIREQIQNLE